MSFSPHTCAPAAATLLDNDGDATPPLVVPLGLTFLVYTAPADSVYFFAPPAAADDDGPARPYVRTGAGAAACRLRGYSGPVVQVAYGEVTDAGGDDSPPRRLEWTVGLTNSSSGSGTSSQAIRFEVRALAAPGAFEDVTMAVAIPPSAFQGSGSGGGGPRFVLAENGVSPVERPSGAAGGGGGNASLSVGEAFFPFVARASLLATSTAAAAHPRPRLRGSTVEPGAAGLAAFHLVGHAPHAVASLAPGRLEVALHRRVPVREITLRV